MKKLIASFVALAGLAGVTSAAHAENVDFTGVVANVCTLAVTTPGVLHMANDGKSLDTTVPVVPTSAIFTVLSIGNSQLTFGAPALVTSPTGYDSTGQTVEIAYTGEGLLAAVDQALTSTETSIAIPNVPATALTVNAKLGNANSFVDGTYTVRSVVTCS